ncbi:MAG: sulfotransferase [Saprospiraceae bacterium]|nr:sulfotransferase [Saprospiraceae bacterium]
MAEKYLRPAFFIIGERKCGTSSFYRYLLDHPRVLPCKIKEPQFFSRSLPYRLLCYARYRALFPKAADTSPARLEWLTWSPSGKLVREELTFPRTAEDPMTGEASANTFAQVPPRRLKRAFPEARLFLLLRNPVDRAWSHYRMFQRFADAGRRMPVDLHNFSTDLRREIAATNQGGRSYFIAPGLYERKLPAWLEVFGDALKVVRSEDLADPSRACEVMLDACRFLNLAPHAFEQVVAARHNTTPASEMSHSDRSLLRSFYTPSVRQVEHILGRQMHWT